MTDTQMPSAAADKVDTRRREMLGAGTMLLGMLGLAPAASAMSSRAQELGPAVSPLPVPPFPTDFPGDGAIPWIKRIFHLYTGPDQKTRVEQLGVNEPEGLNIATLLRREAFRVTIGGSAPGAGFDFHVANNPTLLIPLFGSMIIGLDDGENYELKHGDLAFAEDCTGKGHISRSGPEGSFMVSVQLPADGCPATGSSDMQKIWSE